MFANRIKFARNISEKIILEIRNSIIISHLKTFIYYVME